jgi:hypothetical protein
MDQVTMTALLELPKLLLDLVFDLYEAKPRAFLVAVVVGFLLAGSAWWAARAVALNFNRDFHFKPQFHVYCGTAAIITLIFVVIFVALERTLPDVTKRIADWEQLLAPSPDSPTPRPAQTQEWSRDTFRAAYEAVYRLHDVTGRQLEDFSRYPHPDDNPDTRIPLTTVAARAKTAEVYAQSAVTHFRDSHPLLGWMLSARTDAAAQTIPADMQRFFSAQADVLPDSEEPYQLKHAVRLAAQAIRAELDAQVPRVVLVARALLVLLFLLAQTLVFGLLIRSALADIREPRLSQETKR